MIMKTRDLTGADLDRAVAMALGWIRYPTDSIEAGTVWHMDPERAPFGRIVNVREFRPSADIAQGWPIIEREFICLNGDDGAPNTPPSWTASIFDDGETKADGPTALVAAMRCFVAWRCGDEINLESETEKETIHKHLAVIGRPHGNDEDDVMFYENMSLEQASKVFVEDMNAIVQDIHSALPEAVYVNYILVSGSPITIAEHNV